MNNNENRNSNGNNQQTQEAFKLEFTNARFDGTFKSKLCTTLSLGALIGSLLRPVFSDYEGCNIAPNNYGQLDLVIFFKDHGEPSRDQIKNIENVMGAVKRDAKPMDRINNINLRNKAKVYNLTEKTKSALTEFLVERPGQKINWNQHVYEITERNAYGYQQQIYVKVLGLDLVKVIRAAYGKKAEDGTRYDYSINIVKPLDQFSGTNTTNWLVSILQLDTRDVESLCKEIGVMPMNGSIPMIR